MSEQNLLPNQIDTIFRAITDGFTDTQVAQKINALSLKGEADDEGHPWPTITRQGVAYWRKKFDEDGHSIAGGELVHGTIVSRREAIIRRYANQMGEVEMTMDSMKGEMRELELAGALMGASLRTTVSDDGGGVIEGSVLSVDGKPVNSQIVVRSRTAATQKLQTPDILHPDLDPLFQRYVQLGHLYVKLVQQWQRIVQDLARVCGYGFPPNAAAPAPMTPGGSSLRDSLLSALGSLD